MERVFDVIPFCFKNIFFSQVVVKRDKQKVKRINLKNLSKTNDSCGTWRHWISWVTTTFHMRKDDQILWFPICEMIFHCLSFSSSRQTQNVNELNSMLWFSLTLFIWTTRFFATNKLFFFSSFADGKKLYFDREVLQAIEDHYT